MSLIQEALESCANCTAGKGGAAPDGQVVNGYDGKHDPKAIRQTGVTYQDNDEGIHDTVMIKGPLSEAFTKALNLKFKKKPLQPVQETPSPEQATEEVVEQQNADEKNPLLKQHSSEKIGIGSESSQIDEQNLQYMIREFDDHSAEVQFVANKFDFMTPSQLPKNIACQATLISMTDFMTPSKATEIIEQAANCRTQKVLVVVSDALGRATDLTTKGQLVDIHYTGGEYANFKNNPELVPAVESYQQHFSMPIVVGLEGFFAYLEDFWNNKRK